MDLMQLEELKRRLIETDQFDVVAQDFTLRACIDEQFLDPARDLRMQLGDPLLVIADSTDRPPASRNTSWH